MGIKVIQGRECSRHNDENIVSIALHYDLHNVSSFSQLPDSSPFSQSFSFAVSRNMFVQ